MFLIVEKMTQYIIICRTIFRIQLNVSRILYFFNTLRYNYYFGRCKIYHTKYADHLVKRLIIYQLYNIIDFKINHTHIVLISFFRSVENYSK